MRVIAVTGAAGYVAGRMFEALESDPLIERIIGIDIRQPAYTSPRFQYVHMDVNDDLEPTLRAHQVDTLVHLAFILNPGHDKRLMRRINVHGTRNVLNACAKTGVKQILVTSSAVVYGAYPDNPVPLKEDAPLRGNPTFPYAADKVEIERICATYMEQRPECRFVVVRPAIVFGPHVNNYLSHYLEKPIIFSPAGYDPPVQFLHEDDIAHVIVGLLQAEARGIYNLAGDGTITLMNAARLAGKKPVGLPIALLAPINTVLWHARISALSEAPSAMLDYLRYPWVIDNSKLKRDFPNLLRYTSQDALAAFLNGRRTIKG